MNKVVLLIFTIALFMGSCSKKDSPVSNAAAASTTASPAGTTCVPIEIDSPGIKATIVYFDDKKGDLDKITIVENGTTSVSQVGFNGIDDEVGSYYYRKGSQGFGWSYPGVCNSVDYKDSNQNSIYNDWFVVRKFPDGKDRVCEVDKDFTRAHSHGRDSVIYDSSGNVIRVNKGYIDPSTLKFNLTGFTLYKYDNQKGVLSNVKYYNILLRAAYHTWGPNNCTEIQEYDCFNGNTNGTLKNTTTFTYTYNAKGYPESAIINPSYLTNKITYTYSCP